VNEYEQLKAMLNGGGMRLGIAVRPMNSPGSPVYRMPENVWPPAVVLAASLLSTWAVHYYLGFAVLAAGCWWWLTKIQPRISNEVYERTSALVLNDITAFDGLWRKGVLSLIVTMPDGSQQVATRRDDWRAFVRHFAGAE
jgi:hypothetical protein